MAKTLYILDGHSQIYRAVLAKGAPLSSPDGEPTRGTFYFVQILFDLINTLKPDYLCVAMDSYRDTLVRREVFPPYKLSRGDHDEDVGIQVTQG